MKSTIGDLRMAREGMVSPMWAAVGIAQTSGISAFQLLNFLADQTLWANTIALSPLAKQASNTLYYLLAVTDGKTCWVEDVQGDDRDLVDLVWSDRPPGEP